MTRFFVIVLVLLAGACRHEPMGLLERDGATGPDGGVATARVDAQASADVMPDPSPPSTDVLPGVTEDALPPQPEVAADVLVVTTTDMMPDTTAPTPMPMPRPGCGNGVVEAGERCDPPGSCPTSCPPRGCMRFRLEGSAQACTARCVEEGMQTACVAGDGCCPGGCTSANDSDCSPRCGNGVLERGETCDPVADCTARQMACKSDATTIRTPSGSPASCNFRCDSSPRPCGAADGQCPTGCNRDPDCTPRPTSCVHIEWCRKPTAPNQGQVICITNDDPGCSDAERAAECARDARVVCGDGHVRPIIYSPPIGGASSG